MRPGSRRRSRTSWSGRSGSSDARSPAAAAPERSDSSPRARAYPRLVATSRKEIPMRVPPDRLRQLTATILARGGSEPAEADLVAAHLVDANLTGPRQPRRRPDPALRAPPAGGPRRPQHLREGGEGRGRLPHVRRPARVRTSGGRRGDGRRDGARPGDGRGGRDARELAPRRAGRRLRRAGQRGRARLDPLRERGGSHRAGGALPRERLALLHQPGLHRHARHRHPAAAPARHGHERRGDGQGGASRSGQARSCPTAT